MKSISDRIIKCLDELHSWECHEDICNYLYYPAVIEAINPDKYTLAYIMYEPDDNYVYLFNKEDVIDSVEYDGDVDTICRRLDHSFSDHLNELHALRQSSMKE